MVPLFRPIRLRPSPAFAATASLCLHAAAIAAAFVWETWIVKIREPATFGGERKVVQIELTLTGPASAAPAPPVTIESLADVQPLIHHTAPLSPGDSSSIDPTALAAELPVARRDDALAEIARRDLKSPVAEQPADSAPSAAPPKRRSLPRQPAAPQLEPLPNRRPTPSPVPSVPQVSLPQIAGTDDQTPPDFSGNSKPEYPAAAYRSGIEGVVLLRLWINAAGQVEKLAIHQSSGHAILDRAAVAAVRAWRGRPATRNGQPIATEQLLSIHFRLPAR